MSADCDLTQLPAATAAGSIVKDVGLGPSASHSDPESSNFVVPQHDFRDALRGQLIDNPLGNFATHVLGSPSHPVLGITGVSPEIEMVTTGLCHCQVNENR